MIKLTFIFLFFIINGFGQFSMDSIVLAKNIKLKYCSKDSTLSIRVTIDFLKPVIDFNQYNDFYDDLTKSFSSDYIHLYSSEYDLLKSGSFWLPKIYYKTTTSDSIFPLQISVSNINPSDVCDSNCKIQPSSFYYDHCECIEGSAHCNLKFFSLTDVQPRWEMPDLTAKIPSSFKIKTKTKVVKGLDIDCIEEFYLILCYTSEKGDVIFLKLGNG